MGMFDRYLPAGELRCPFDGHLLREWQGKEGPCALFLWQEGVAHPIAQGVDEDVRLAPEEWTSFLLPDRFTIYCYDCAQHEPIFAICTTRNGIWDSTQLQWPGGEIAPQER